MKSPKITHQPQDVAYAEKPKQLRGSGRRIRGPQSSGEPPKPPEKPLVDQGSSQ